MPTPTKEQVTAAMKVFLAIGDAIREAGEIPSGALYAIVMGRIDIHQYNTVIDTLKNAGLVSESANLLTWIGPKGAAV